MFPDRIFLTIGDTTKTLPEFQRNRPEIKCNLIVMPNKQAEKKVPYRVFNHFANMVNRTYPHNIILMENWTKKVSETKSTLWDTQVRTSKAGEIFRCTNAINTRTLVVGWYR